MDVMAYGDGFMFPIGFGEFEFAADKKSGDVILRSKEPTTITVETGDGVFVEALSKDGDVLAGGGDGSYLRVPISKDAVTLRYKKLEDPRLSPAAINKKRQKVRRVLCSDMPYSLGVPNSLDGAIKWLSNKLSEIPEKCRKSATVDFSDSWSHGESYSNLRIEYMEPETDAEVIHRVQVEAERGRAKEADERARYQELSKKFGT